MTNFETKTKLNELIKVLDDLKGFSAEGTESLKIERMNQTARRQLIEKNIKIVDYYNKNRGSIHNHERLKAALVSMAGIILFLIFASIMKLDVPYIALSAIPAFPSAIFIISYYNNKKLDLSIESLQVDPELIELCNESITYCNEHLKHYEHIDLLIKEVEDRIHTVHEQLTNYDEEQLVFTNVDAIEEEIESIKRLVNTYYGN